MNEGNGEGRMGKRERKEDRKKNLSKTRKVVQLKKAKKQEGCQARYKPEIL